MKKNFLALRPPSSAMLSCFHLSLKYKERNKLPSFMGSNRSIAKKCYRALTSFLKTICTENPNCTLSLNIQRECHNSEEIITCCSVKSVA